METCPAGKGTYICRDKNLKLDKDISISNSQVDPPFA